MENREKLYWENGKEACTVVGRWNGEMYLTPVLIEW
jgi:hypothetical protein